MNVPSAALVAATALGRPGWCRRDGAHLFGVRMAIGGEHERVLRADDAALRVSEWFGQEENEQVPFGVVLFDAAFVRVRRGANATAQWRVIRGGSERSIECHAAFVLFDVDASRPLRSPVFGELPFRVVAPGDAPAWLHHHHHVFATRPQFLDDASAASLPEPGELPQPHCASFAWSGVRLGHAEDADPMRQQMLHVTSRTDLIAFAERLATGQQRDAAQRLRRLAAALDTPRDAGIDPEAAAVSWRQLAFVLWRAFG